MLTFFIYVHLVLIQAAYYDMPSSSESSSLEFAPTLNSQSSSLYSKIKAFGKSLAEAAYKPIQKNLQVFKKNPGYQTVSDKESTPVEDRPLISADSKSNTRPGTTSPESQKLHQGLEGATSFNQLDYKSAKALLSDFWTLGKKLTAKEAAASIPSVEKRLADLKTKPDSPKNRIRIQELENKLLFLQEYSKLSPEQISKVTGFRNGEIVYEFEKGPNYDKLMTPTRSARVTEDPLQSIKFRDFDKELKTYQAEILKGNRPNVDAAIARRTGEIKAAETFQASKKSSSERIKLIEELKLQKDILTFYKTSSANDFKAYADSLKVLRNYDDYFKSEIIKFYSTGRMGKNVLPLLEKRLQKLIALPKTYPAKNILIENNKEVYNDLSNRKPGKTNHAGSHTALIAIK